ncbi:hypothetical protein MN608_08685 [Microdochium nivale]|nr:hypothetical protein MN608_08685 [Microdochium nivale]
MLGQTNLGNIKALIVLNDAARVHCGPDDPVLGHVQLTYFQHPRLPPNHELFGPVKIFLLLRGQLLVTDRRLFPLFSSGEQCIFDGALACKSVEKCEFPFQMRFPDRIDWDNYLAQTTHVSQRVPAWEDPLDKHTFNDDQDQPLPPTMEVGGSSFANIPEEVAVYYELCVRMEMPGIDVDISQNTIPMGSLLGWPDYRGTPVLYECARARVPVYEELQRLGGFTEIKDRSFAVIADGIEGSGFRSKASKLLHSSLSSRPVVMLGWHVMVPSAVHRGQPLVLQIRVQPSEVKSTAAVTPAIELVKLTAIVEALVEGRVQARKSYQVEYKKQIEVAKEEVVFGSTKRVDQDKSWLSVDDNSHNNFRRGTSRGRFSSSSSSRSGATPPATAPTALFTSENGWTQAVLLSNITKNLCSSFRTVCIHRSYVLRVSCRIRMAGVQREEKISKTVRFTVHPPLASADDDGLGALPPPTFEQAAGSDAVTEPVLDYLPVYAP